MKTYSSLCPSSHESAPKRNSKCHSTYAIKLGRQGMKLIVLNCDVYIYTLRLL